MNYFPKESRLLCNIVRLILGQNNTQNHGILQTILQQQYGIKSINQSWYDVNGGLVKSIRVWVIISHNFTWIKSLIHAIGEATKGYEHDDVIKWKHFPRYWPFVRGIHRSPVNSPHKGQWRGALMFTLICARINGWVNNREAGDLRRYRAHYDVIVMKYPTIDILPVSTIYCTLPVSSSVLGRTYITCFIPLYYLHCFIQKPTNTQHCCWLFVFYTRVQPTTRLAVDSTILCVCFTLFS